MQPSPWGGSCPQSSLSPWGQGTVPDPLPGGKSCSRIPQGSSTGQALPVVPRLGGGFGGPGQGHQFSSRSPQPLPLSVLLLKLFRGTCFLDPQGPLVPSFLSLFPSTPLLEPFPAPSAGVLGVRTPPGAFIKYDARPHPRQRDHGGGGVSGAWKLLAGPNAPTAPSTCSLPTRHSYPSSGAGLSKPALA